MTVRNPRSRMISIRLSEQEYLGLKRLCLITGARSVSDLTRDAMRVLLNGVKSDDILGLRMDEFGSLLKSLDRRSTRLQRELHPSGPIDPIAGRWARPINAGMKSMLDLSSQLAGLGSKVEEVPSAAPSRSDYEVTLIDVLTQLALRKRLILGITGAVALIGVAVSLLLPLRYSATTRIMPPQQTQSTASMMMNQLASSGAGSMALLAGGGLGLRIPTISTSAC